MFSPAYLAACVNSALAVKTFDSQTYVGNGTSQNIVTGIDGTGSNKVLSVFKKTNGAKDWGWYDSVRGINKYLKSNSNLAEQSQTATDGLYQFNSDGVTVGTSTVINESSGNYLALNFLAEEGFFDIVKFTGNRPSSQVVPHSAGEVGALLFKNTNTTNDWQMWFRGFGATDFMRFGTTNAKETGSTGYLNSTLPTSTQFEVGDNFGTNGNGNEIIAYLFAHNPAKGIFCGSYSGSGAAGNKQTLGFRPDLLILKQTGVAGGWYTLGASIGLSGSSFSHYLEMNSSGALIAQSSGFRVIQESDGFSFESNSFNTGDYIFIAIGDPA